VEAFQLAPLLNDEESSDLSKLRLKLFKQYWTTTEAKIQVFTASNFTHCRMTANWFNQTILNEANEGTLDEVTGFIQAEEYVYKQSVTTNVLSLT
jgi:origin recognition complex subunit 3